MVLREILLCFPTTSLILSFRDARPCAPGILDLDMSTMSTRRVHHRKDLGSYECFARRDVLFT